MQLSKKKVAIIDYGMGNICSVQKACAFLGYEGELIDRPEKLMTASRAILPGVGAFGDAMAALEERGFTAAIKEYAAQGHPLFGICLGMQLMFTGSSEGLEAEISQTGEEEGMPALAANPLPLHKGLALFPGIIRRFPANLLVKVPHIGWNLVECQSDSSLFADLPQKFNAYFVHSYFAGDIQASYAAGLCRHGMDFVAAIEKDNLWATQFHPEKSGDLGIRLLSNFLRRNPHVD